MANLIKKWKGICVNLAENNNKFWQCELYDNAMVITRFGRVVDEAEDKAKFREFPQSSQYAAERLYEKKLHEKQNKSKPDERYTEVKTLDASVGDNIRAAAQVSSVQRASLAEIAKRDIGVSSPETIQLIEELAAANIHAITSQTAIAYNKISGLFESPLGIVTSDAIREARQLLGDMGNLVYAQRFNDQFIDLTNQYLRRVPKDIGRTRKAIQDIFPDLSAIQTENDILDSLEASLQTALTTPTPTGDQSAPQPPKMFNVTLHLVTDKAIIERIKGVYNKTRQGIHAASKLNVSKVYLVEIDAMKRAYMEHGEPLGTVWELWHGSRIGNLLSIMKGGFVIPPSNAAHCTGRLLGNGVYFSDQSTKSLNYAYGTAPGQRGGLSNRCFMFICAVAMGKYYCPKNWNMSFPVAGYDSTFAKGGECSLANNEMVAYKTAQINPRFLVEFA